MTKFCFYKQGSRDNMSIVLVTFPAAPKPSHEAIERDLALNKNLESLIRGMFIYLHACKGICI